MRKRYVLIIVIAALALVIAAANLFFGFKVSFHKTAAGIIEGFLPSGALQKRIAFLEKENADLKAQLFRETVTPQGSAIVYSSYPFNNKSEIIISWGKENGVLEGDAVTYGGNILVGRVREVAEKGSVVMTIFDPGFETAVRIGADGADALMRGGNELTLDLISEDASIETGDHIVSAGSEFPYGLDLGRIKEIRVKGGSVFRTATVEPSFEVRALRNVNVLR